MSDTFARLEAVLHKNRPVLVQTHDFPDHDALGAAYGLCELLLRRGYESSIVYGGELQSISLETMIERLDIPVQRLAEIKAATAPQIVVVDGSPANGTVGTLAGELRGVIDHHPAQKDQPCHFCDIRSEIGACSTIIWGYWKEAGEQPDRTTATALLAGIQLDTDFLSRRVSQADLDAHYELFFLGDCDLSREVVRTSMDVSQLPVIGAALKDCVIHDSFLFTELHGDYSSELLSVLADFLLRLKEITFVVVVEVRGSEYHLSARTRDKAIDAGYIVRAVLQDIGSGGGHPHMAGGIIRPERYPGAKQFSGRILATLKSYRSTHGTDSQTPRA